ncbi:MAG: hypothetical protein ACYC2P_10685 [Paludibacteraceae bacterium]
MSAQDDDVLLKAMKTEIDRSKAEFKRDSLVRPFFISMISGETDLEYTCITAFGKESKEELDTRKSINASSQILVGDYHRTQNFSTNSNGFSLPAGNDEKAIRTAIWMNLDEQYKTAAKNYVDKMAWLKQENLKADELALDDFEKRGPTVLIQDVDHSDYNFSKAKQLSLKTGKLLADKVKQEKLLVENLTTTFNFTHDITRYYDTEGSMYRYPTQNGKFNITLTGVTEKGEDVGAYRSFRLNKLNELPSDELLEKAINDMVTEYKIKYSTEELDDPYIGPLLIVDGEVESVVKQITNSLYTSPKTRFSNGNQYQNMPGIRVISRQLSLVINYGKSAQNMKGVKRDLAPVDIQAVIPPDSIQLLKEGILKNMLTSRQPVKNFLHSNGNAKNGNELDGVITFTGNQVYSYGEIKKMLLDEARLQGLEYAYIMNADGKLHSKVNVETGEEVPFTANFNFGQTMKTMRRVLGVENKMAASADGTIRYPKSILLEDAELTVYKSNNRLKKDFVPRPKL